MNQKDATTQQKVSKNFLNEDTNICISIIKKICLARIPKNFLLLVKISKKNRMAKRIC
jgi:hypothetical protein